MREIELLSPAKTFEHGIEAVNHGADAVYIGAPLFSARANAGNSIQEIEKLIYYAHQYYAKVYVALNTILTDEELEQAEKIIHQLYNIGTDALIIQDMGITQLNLPPIALHASTQMDNRSVDKVQFLEKIGFEQVVLARELSLDQIREIHSKTNVRLEGFVHGALCVSYSGQCYLSQSVCGRSANRGVCAQLCRLPYSLQDAQGNILIKDKYLLSLKDFNLSNYIEELIDAGISSLKIEGRLKDISYVKNVTAYYRQKLDNILEGNKNYTKASSGQCEFYFIPTIEKSFHRGSTDYFLHGRNKNITSFDTPKSLGEEIGKVIKSNGKSITVQTKQKMNNGDGFCFMNSKQQFEGFKANTVTDNTIYPAERIAIQVGTTLYRNYDHAFEKQLAQKSASRKIQACVVIKEVENGFIFQIEDENHNMAESTLITEKIAANDKEKQKENLIKTIKKCGDTIFSIETILLETSDIFFFPAAIIAETRRNLLNKLIDVRNTARERKDTIIKESDNKYILSTLDYRANVHNQKAKNFYQKHHVISISDSLEKKEPKEAELARCKHCIKYSLGYCTKEYKGHLYEPLQLVTNTGKILKLSFDCGNCEMIIKKS